MGKVDSDDIITGRENTRSWFLKALDEGPYKFKNLVPEGSINYTIAKCKRILEGDGLIGLHDAEWRFMNLFTFYPNEIRQFSVDACTIAKDMLANTGSSSRQTSSYYVTHPTSVVDYDDEYQQDDVHNNSEDPIVSAMLLLAKAITQNFSNPTNNRLRASSNTKSQAIIQGDRVNNQIRNSGNTSTVQCYNYSGKGHYARNCPKPRVRDSKYFMEQMLLAKQDEAGVILIDEQNDFLFADASRIDEIEEHSANICLWPEFIYQLIHT
ncbi:retrovirus-related pol polyprotein from transposon TNT 1-94 [Tanacetum coccineum]